MLENDFQCNRLKRPVNTFVPVFKEKTTLRSWSTDKCMCAAPSTRQTTEWAQWAQAQGPDGVRENLELRRPQTSHKMTLNKLIKIYIERHKNNHREAQNDLRYTKPNISKDHKVKIHKWTKRKYKMMPKRCSTTRQTKWHKDKNKVKRWETTTRTSTAPRDTKPPQRHTKWLQKETRTTTKTQMCPESEDENL